MYLLSLIEYGLGMYFQFETGRQVAGYDMDKSFGQYMFETLIKSTCSL